MPESKLKAPQNVSAQPIQQILNTSVARKLILALSGLALLVFSVFHLLGNLTLFVSPAVFNDYAHKLESLGFFLYIMEIGLLAAFLFHIIYAIEVTRENRRARNTKYNVEGEIGAPSKMTISSRSMIYTGIVVGVFTLLHLMTFKFGTYYEIVQDGKKIRDLHRLVVEVFQNEMYVTGYVAAMLFFGFHLRHGFWSAFQSLGAYHRRYTRVIYLAGILVAASLALGFLALPIWVYFKY